jgi:hypothetical protein
LDFQEAPDLWQRPPIWKHSHHLTSLTSPWLEMIETRGFGST